VKWKGVLVLGLTIEQYSTTFRRNGIEHSNLSSAPLLICCGTCGTRAALLDYFKPQWKGHTEDSVTRHASRLSLLMRCDEWLASCRVRSGKHQASRPWLVEKLGQYGRGAYGKAGSCVVPQPEKKNTGNHGIPSFIIGCVYCCAFPDIWLTPAC
jgi:hypothetical protein